MSQVSVSTKIVKAHWIAAISHPYFAAIGLTKSVQLYCRLAIIVMHSTPRASWNHLPVVLVATLEAGAFDPV
jgi:hypothetical protein